MQPFCLYILLLILPLGLIAKEPIPINPFGKTSLKDGWTFQELPNGKPVSIEVGNSLSSQGFPPPTSGVYEVHFLFPKEEITSAVGIYLDRVQEADKIFLNGKWIGGTGVLPNDGKYSPNWYYKRLYFLPDSLLKKGEINTIRIQIFYQNKTFPGGIFRSIPQIGNYELIRNNIIREDGRDFCIIMLFFGIGAYQIFSILLRRQPRSNFFLLCSSMCFVLWRLPLLNISHSVFELEFNTLIRVFFVFQTLLPAALLLFNYSIFRDPVRLKEWILLSIIFLLAFVQIFDIEYSSRIIALRIWEFTLIFVFSFVVVSVYRAAKQKKMEANILGAGFLLLSLCGTVDIIIDLTSGKNIYLSQYGFLILMILSAITISFRNAKNEKELSLLTKDLEARVQIRTEELRKKNSSLEQDLFFASQLQGHLLPKDAPSITGLNLSATYLPMSQVGGDLYDWIEVDEHRLLFLIADVAGHGVPAALVSSMVKVQFRESAKETQNPAEVLLKMNQALIFLVSKYFITASCALFDTKKNQVIISSAGHPNPLIYNQFESKFQFLNLKGSILGWRETFQYQNWSQNITKGDRFFFYTDGVTEARAEGKLFGEANLLRILKKSKTKEIQTVSELVLKEISDYSDEELKDDVTYVLIEIT
ncbi:PP2C family protein-serine/threonine phosphatase [Leptospira idonii]|uniref:Serine/threonine-protein phosphatase n=1 Tax=Leptospira idonii TaxID=1193500 RepID=A0A4R9LVR6_9LEPT|nr:PP2C family protein-serine/threonine phosphatase [Leptospira idonii]TGN17284.1 serine/threonine-protein phosphatase [Leptospira idonii]